MKESYEEEYAYLEKRIDALKTDRTGDERQTEAEVFDRKTLMTIYGFMKRGLLDRVQFPISTGKEGNVFYATDSEGSPVALKIYRTSTSTFKKVAKYVEGDPRFRGTTGNRWKFIYAWASKEYKNLERYWEAELPVPEPVTCQQNCLLMEYIGDETGPCPQLRNAELEDPQETYEEIVDFIVRGWAEAGLVHGDLSEYNVLMRDGEPVVIDVGQGMTADWYNAKELLRRDIGNVNRFFANRGAEVTPPEEIERECEKAAEDADGEEEDE